MLCLHVPSLLPHPFADMDTSSVTQAAALAGVGLLYQVWWVHESWVDHFRCTRTLGREDLESLVLSFFQVDKRSPPGDLMEGLVGIPEQQYET